jgi:hypothetical protein
VPGIKILWELVSIAQLFAENRKPKAFLFPSRQLQNDAVLHRTSMFHQAKKKDGSLANPIRYQTETRPASLGKSNP